MEQTVLAAAYPENWQPGIKGPRVIVYLLPEADAHALEAAWKAIAL
jgi:hypothetical protein